MNPAIPPAMHTGTFEPTDLEFLQRFFQNACAERGVEDNTAAASNLAAQIIRLYQQGVRKEIDLKTELSIIPLYN